MPLPGDLTTITVTGTYLDAAGTPLSGHVVFTPTADLQDSTGRTVLRAAPLYASLVAGAVSIVLPCTDNTTLNPTSWAYTVAETLTDGVSSLANRNYTIQLPHTLGATVDLTALIPVNPPTSYSTFYGVLTQANTWTGANAFNGGISLDGVTIAAPTSINTEFLAADGVWRVPTGGPPAGAAGGDLTGTYPNPTLGATANVNAIVRASRLDQMATPTAPVSLGSQKLTSVANGTASTDGVNLGQIPTALPPSGAASGDLTGTYPGPTLAATTNVNNIIRANRLDQMAAPTAAVPMNGQKLTGGAPGSASTDFATVGQLSTVPRDPYTAMLGLVSQPYPLDTTNNDNLGASAGCLILALNRPPAVAITNLGLWLQIAGTGPGPASMGVFPSAGGARLAVTGDMSAALTNAANNDTYVESALLVPYTADGVTDYYYGVFTNFVADAKIGGVFAESGLHIPTVKGNHPMLVFTGLSSMPSTIDLSGAITAAAAYWLAAS